MKDFQIQLAKQVNPDQVAALEQEKAAIQTELKQLEDKLAPLLAVIDNEQGVKQLIDEKNFNIPHLQEKHKISNELVELLYKYGKLQFDVANYGSAADYLHYYRLLIDNTFQDLSMLKRSYGTQWGVLAAKILLSDFEGAFQDLQSLRDVLDGNHANLLFDTTVEQLQHRTWLIHWSLFVFFNHANGKNAIIDLFFQDKYLNAIQTTCPYILRYLATAVIVNKKRRNMLKELSRVIEQELSYSDPILKFVECLHCSVDFEGAQAELSKCETLLKNDYFLVNCKQDFLDNARQYIFESYCRIHRVIDVEILASKLKMDKASAEKWIINLIRNARYSAKIEGGKTNRIIMQEQYPNVYQQIVEKTEGATLRTSILRQNVETKLNEKKLKAQ